MNEPVLLEVSDGIYAYLQPDGRWWVNNAGVVVSSHSAFSIDTCATQARTEEYQRRIRSVTSAPVRAVVSTHHHGDHTFGNFLFPNAAILAHEGARDAMRAWGLPRSEPYWTPVAWGDVTIELPLVTFSDRVTLWADDLRCEVMHVQSPAHTSNDSIVWISERRVLFSGDLIFNGGTPFLLQGSLAGSLSVLDTVVRPLNPEVIVPGHGLTCGAEAIDTTIRYLEFVRDAARAAHGAGLNPLDAARELDLGEFAEWGDAERIVGNLHRAYSELDGARPGEALDYAAILADMVTYNGGPLTTHA